MRATIGSLAAICLLVAGCGSGDLAANAGDDFEVSVGEQPAFDGCGSAGDISNYAWTIIDAPDGRADDVGKPIEAESAECSAMVETAMVVDEIGRWEIELVVTGLDGSVDADVVAVNVVP